MDQKEKTWNLTRDEVIIKEMYNCLVAISESLVTYTKEYNADSFEGIGSALYNVLNAHDVVFDDLWRNSMPKSMFLKKDMKEEEGAKENVEC